MHLFRRTPARYCDRELVLMSYSCAADIAVTTLPAPETNFDYERGLAVLNDECYQRDNSFIWFGFKSCLLCLKAIYRSFIPHRDDHVSWKCSNFFFISCLKIGGSAFFFIFVPWLALFRRFRRGCYFQSTILESFVSRGNTSFFFFWDIQFCLMWKIQRLKHCYGTTYYQKFKKKRNKFCIQIPRKLFWTSEIWNEIWFVRE